MQSARMLQSAVQVTRIDAEIYGYLCGFGDVYASVVYTSARTWMILQLEIYKHMFLHSQRTAISAVRRTGH